ncbi:MAG: dihydropteroate synthase [Planctomycetota bacterium]|nr:dihydropteroate synthase [Planctomycetota bacterium]MDP6939455.1 dihydropteroate synthase [Planctomycetota bacterium]
MSKTPHRLRQTCGPLGVDLNPLIWPGKGLIPGQMCVELRPAKGRSEELDLLRERLDPSVETLSSGTLSWRCDAAALEEQARENALAALLLDTWRAYSAPCPTPKLMGVLNVTPDSFSDGGRFLDPERALEQGRRLSEEGAMVLDVGGESTRPGAQPVDEAEELARVLPVIQALAAELTIPLSIDTTKAGVAEAALEAGASWVNDVSACSADGRMLSVVAEHGARVVLMHSQGRPQEMQTSPTYQNPTEEVSHHLRSRAAACLEAGVAPDQILIDPGIGFGKRLEHNLALMRELPTLRSLGLPLLVGVSRKSFIGHVTGSEDPALWREGSPEDEPSGRMGGTAAALSACVLGGAEYLRVHDVAVMAEAAAVAATLRPEVESPA